MTFLTGISQIFSRSPYPTPRKASRGAVFRVTSIHNETSLAKVNDALSAKFPSLVADETSLCPSPDGRSQTAIVHFADPPVGAVHSVVVDGREARIDCDFQGLTQLYPIPKDEIRADLIALCGLNGHAYGSWSSTNPDSGKRTMWLRHFLKDDQPKLRTMIYGYETSLSEDYKGIHRIADYADNFLEEVKKARNSDQAHLRPLILVGHSFGGIVIVQSLVKAKEESEYLRLFECIRASVFFGTPQRGFDVDDIMEMIGPESNRKPLIESLTSGSYELSTTLKRYVDYTVECNIKILSFKETQQTQRLKPGKGASPWTRSGDYTVTVPANSALLQLPTFIEKALPADGNHSTIVKLSYQADRTYTSFLSFLERLEIKEIEPDGRPISAQKAVMTGNTRALRSALITHRGSLHDEITPLIHLAISENQKACTTIILEHEPACVSARDRDENTPFHIAVKHGHEWAISLLLELHADANAMAKGYTPFHQAVLESNDSMVKFLLGKGVNIDSVAQDQNLNPPLHLAAKEGHVETMRLLLRHEADPMARAKDGGTVLHSAAESGQDEMVHMLAAEYPTLIKTLNIVGCLPVHFAAFAGKTQAMEILLKHGSDLWATDYYQRNILHIAALGGHVETVKSLLDKGMSLTDADINGRTPLHQGALEGKLEVVELMVERGAELGMIDEAGCTPHDVAHKSDHVQVVRFLKSQSGRIKMM